MDSVSQLTQLRRWDDLNYWNKHAATEHRITAKYKKHYIRRGIWRTSVGQSTGATDTISSSDSKISNDGERCRWVNDLRVTDRRRFYLLWNFHPRLPVR